MQQVDFSWSDELKNNCCVIEKRACAPKTFPHTSVMLGTMFAQLGL